LPRFTQLTLKTKRNKEARSVRGNEDGAPLNICHELCMLNRHWSKTSAKLLNTLNRNDHAFVASPAPALTNAQALGRVARLRTCKPFCTRCVCLCLEQIEDKAGVRWGIVVTRYVGRGAFTKCHAEGGICR
jgi:hypothetical protein